MSSTSQSIRVAVPESARAVVAVASPPAGLAEMFAENAIEVAYATPEAVAEHVLNGTAELVVLDSSTAAMRICRLLKSNPGTHFVPVIVVGASDPEARRRAFLEGADHVVGDAVDAEEVIARTWSLLRTFHLFKMFEDRRKSLKVRRDWVRYLARDFGQDLARFVYDVLFLRRRLQHTDPEALETLADLEKSVDRAVTMMRNYLVVDRSHIDALPARVAPVAVADVARSAAARAAPAAQARGATVAVEPAELWALADKESLERVLSALIEHAVLAGPPGGRARLVASADGRDVRVTIAGDGDAVRREDERLLRTGVQRRAGSLAFARTQIEAQGGRMLIEDAPGGGACFVVKLRAAP